MKRILLTCLTAVFALASLAAWAQERTVKGRITSSQDGTGLPGVNVVVKGTTNGTVTDVDGNYTIVAPASGTLVFSFIGLKSQEIVIGERTVLDVPMDQDVTQLTEVIVTALGIEKSAKSIGYSVAKVKSDELTQAKAFNVSQALTGKVAGLQINNLSSGVNPQTRITLRGNRSFTGNNQALVVIDGVQSSQEALNYLNPGDIDNISVLKGANAAALYGADASNGALIVTTKKGNNVTPTLEFSNTTYWEAINYMPKFQERFGGGTESYSRVYIPFENQSYGPEYNGEVVNMGRELEDGTYQTTPYSYKKDAKKKSFDVGHTVQNNLSLSGGDANSTYYISLQDVNTKGVVPGDENRRTGIRVNASRTFNKFKAGFNVNYSLRQTDKTRSDFYNNVLNTPGQVPLNEYRNWRPYKNADGSMNYANPNNYFNDYFYNPFMDKDINRQKERYGYLLGNVDLSYQATDWMSATYRLGVTNESFDYLQTQEQFNYTAYAKSTGKSTAQKNITGFSGDFVGYKNKLVQDFILAFKKTFGPIKADLIVGNNVREQRNVGVNVSANQLVLPGVYNISNRIGETSGGQGLQLSRVIGYYGDLTLGYNDYLFLHVSGREDSYSVLSKSNRSFFYPGADVSFVATDAIPSLKDNSILSYAKFTASATKVGNVNIDPYSLQTTFSPGGGFPYGSLAGYSIGDTYADPNLKPEFTKSYEVGGDFAFLDNRISLELAYYTQETTNQTVSIDIASSTGFSRARVNAGTMKNKGYEVSLKATPISTADGFKWEVGVIYANRNTEVTSLYGGSNINISGLYGLTTDGSLGQVFAQIGQQYPIVKAVAYLRDPQGRVVVDPSSGYPIKDPSLKTFGQGNPKDNLSLSTSLKYKGFALSALAEYRGGYVVYHGIASTMWFTGVAEATGAYGRERFVFPNSSIQNADGTYTANTTVATRDGGLGAWDSNLRSVGENFVTSGEFWKLRELSLSYSVPKSILSNVKFVKGATVGLVGRNLFMWLPSENKYSDPELSSTNADNALSANAVGLNSTTSTPSTRTYGFNISLTF